MDEKGNALVFIMAKRVFFHKVEKEKDADVHTTPSGRRLRKPARYREIYTETDKAVKLVDPGRFKA